MQKTGQRLSQKQQPATAKQAPKAPENLPPLQHTHEALTDWDPFERSSYTAQKVGTHLSLPLLPRRQSKVHDLCVLGQLNVFQDNQRPVHARDGAVFHARLHMVVAHYCCRGSIERTHDVRHDVLCWREFYVLLLRACCCGARKVLEHLLRALLTFSNTAAAVCVLTLCCYIARYVATVLGRVCVRLQRWNAAVVCVRCLTLSIDAKTHRRWRAPKSIIFSLVIIHKIIFSLCHTPTIGQPVNLHISQLTL